jgi:hypothetical protein
VCHWCLGGFCAFVVCSSDCALLVVLVLTCELAVMVAWRAMGAMDWCRATQHTQTEHSGPMSLDWLVQGAVFRPVTTYLPTMQHRTLRHIAAGIRSQQRSSRPRAPQAAVGEMPPPRAPASPRTGKTQLCHTLCVTTQLPIADGGGAGKVGGG